METPSFVFLREETQNNKDCEETAAYEREEEEEDRAHEQQQFERNMREALAKQEVKRARTLRIFCELPTLAHRFLCLKTTKEMHAQFVANHVEDRLPLVQRTAQLGELSYATLLVRAAGRYQTRMDELNSRIRKDELAMLEFDGWAEHHDEEERQYFTNEEGLSRLDIPTGWINEEIDRERRIDENRNAMCDTEEFMMSRVDNLLEEIHTELEQCLQLEREIQSEMEQQASETIREAQALVQIAIRTNNGILKRFHYEPPRAIPGIPTFGVTNAYSQRRQRCRPNYHAELEEYFDEEY
ncbi:hypothetical protein PFISCL1PPCAC_26550 [Pristionchus fissidentatus]|uniref:Uncharacterized protein n=1 Tax=Pristionchus fissidentatus TaxID=1538716 RepID=A0AAV5WVC8_9BILA|nr:hypothetical protein PFISCL1PPCAC_26550 [Pristionchus fissidentatus]